MTCAEENESSVAVAVSERSERREAKRQIVSSERTLKELEGAGFDPFTLEGLGIDFIALMSDLTWMQHDFPIKVTKDMRDDIEYETSRAQAGGWLDRIAEEDERVAAISRAINQSVIECDELDGLLTLYSVELGV